MYQTQNVNRTFKIQKKLVCKAFGVIITYLSGLLLRLADLLKNGPRPLDLLMLRDHELISDGIVYPKKFNFKVLGNKPKNGIL